MVNGTVNPLQTVIKIAIILPHPPGCSSPSSLQGSQACSAGTATGTSHLVCAGGSEHLKKALDSGHPLLVSVNQEHQKTHSLPIWVHVPKKHFLASSDITRFITAVTWSLLYHTQCIGQVDTGKGAIV